MLKTMGVSIVIGAGLGKDYFRTMDTAQQRVRKMGTALAETNRKMGAAKELDKYRTKLQALKEKQSQLGHSSTRLDAGVAAVEKRYKKAKSAAKAYGITVGNLTRKQKELSRESDRYQKKLAMQANRQQASAKLGELRGKMIGAAGLMYAGGRMVGSAMSREEQGLYLRTVINSRDGDKDAGVGRAMAHSRSFAQKSLASENEVLEIEYALNSAGLAEDVARAGTELVHKLAKVTKGAPEQVGEIFGTTFNNLGDAMTGSVAEKMERIGNVLAKTQFKFQIRDFSQLGESMKYAASSMASAKVPLEQGAAVIGQLNTAGLQGSMAGTAFNAVLKNMSKASEELGFEMVRSADGSLDLMATLDNLKGSLDGMDIDEKGALLQQLFSDEGKRGIVPLLDQLDQLKDAYKEVDEAGRSGLVNEEYERFAKSSAGQFTMLRQNLTQIGTVLGGTLLPAVNLVMKPVAWLFGKVAWAIEKFPMLGWILGGIATGFTAVGVAQAFMAVQMWLANTAMYASPLFWIPAVLVLVGLAVTAFARNWGKIWGWIKDKSVAAWDGIKKGAIFAWDLLKKIFGWTPLGMMMKSWGPAMKFLGKAWDKVKAVGRFFGLGGKQVVAGAAAAATMATTPLAAQSLSAPNLPALNQQAGGDNFEINAPIEIFQKDGETSTDLAREIQYQLATRERKAQSERNGRLYD